MSLCDHIRLTKPVTASGDVCQACVERGDEWVHLRMCATCGVVGCCDDSKNQHASRHAETERHPVIRSYEPGEAWWWCYPDQRFLPEREGWPALRPL